MGSLYHHGIKGQKWGVRRFQKKDRSLTKAGENRYYKQSDKRIKINNDGSKTIPSGFVFNRVGKSTIDINKSGVLYVSHGKEDASRYVKSLGPTPIGKLLRNYGDTVQHITVRKDLKIASETQTAKVTAEALLQNKKILDKFNDSLFSTVVTNDFETSITEKDLKAALKNPSSKYAQKLSYGVSSFLADPNFADESRMIYDSFRKSGYDAIPDIHDVYSGTSKTATIVINPEKLKITSTTSITKDVMKEAKQYVKTLEKLKVNDLIS